MGDLSRPSHDHLREAWIRGEWFRSDHPIMVELVSSLLRDEIPWWAKPLTRDVIPVRYCAECTGRSSRRASSVRRRPAGRAKWNRSPREQPLRHRRRRPVGVRLPERARSVGRVFGERSRARASAQRVVWQPREAALMAGALPRVVLEERARAVQAQDHRASVAQAYRREDRGETVPRCPGRDCGCELDTPVVAHSPRCRA